MSRGYIRNLISFYEEKHERKRQRAEVREVAPIWSLPRNEFLNIYKVSPEMVEYLCQELQEELALRSLEGLPVHVKVLTGLRILIDGHYQRGTGQDETNSIAATTVSKYFAQYLEAVHRRLNLYGWFFLAQMTDDNYLHMDLNKNLACQIFWVQ